MNGLPHYDNFQFGPFLKQKLLKKLSVKSTDRVLKKLSVKLAARVLKRIMIYLNMTLAGY